MKTPVTLVRLAGFFAALSITYAAEQTPPAEHRETSTPSIEQAEPTTGDPQASPWLKEVIKLVESGTENNIIAAYIDSAGTFNLTWQQIVKLRQWNVPNAVVAAMLSHDTQLSAGFLPTPLAPPAGSVLPPLLRATNSVLVATKVATEQKVLRDTIVNASPAEDLWIPWGTSWSFGQDLEAEDGNIGSPFEFGPVRQPQPVQLTSPIRIYRSAWKPANTQVILGFP